MPMDPSVPGKGSPPPRLIAGLDPDPVTRRLIELYLTPLGYELHWIASAEDWPGKQGAATAFLLAATAAPAADRAALDAFAVRLGAVPLLGMAGDVRRFPPGSVPHPVRRVLRKPVRADELLAALESLQPQAPLAAALDSPLVEFEAMVKELEMDAATAADLCQSFVQRGDQYLKELRAAAQPRDDVALDRAAHGFKGMAGNLRFRRVTDLADRLRRAAKAHDGDPPALIRELGTEFDVVRKALEQRGR